MREYMTQERQHSVISASTTKESNPDINYSIKKSQ